MPVSLAKIAANTATVKFLWGEDDVNIVYRPGLVTEKIFTTLNHLNEDGATDEEALAGFGSLNDILARLIVSWDVYEDAEQSVMFPIVASRLAELPIMFRGRIIKEIVSDIRPEALAA